MLVVGLTGGIGSGKTAVSDQFAALGVPIIDTDQLSRELVRPGQPALADIAQQLGAHYINADGELDRRRLREWIFAHPEARKTLENILHPRIRAAVAERLAALQNHAYCLVVIPLLSEARWQNLIQRVLVVDVPETLQLERVIQRDQVSREHAQAILATQVSRATRLALADDVLDNSGARAQLPEHVQLLDARYRQLAQQCN